MVQVIEYLGMSCLANLEGTGEVYVFLHGFPDTKEVWLPIIERMPRFIAIDLPSFGMSNLVPDSEMMITLIASNILLLIKKLRFDSFTLVGHDWGAMIAWELYSQAKTQVTSMIFANGPHPWVYHKILANSADQREIWKYVSFFCSEGAAQRLFQNKMKALKRYHPFELGDGEGSEAAFEKKWSDLNRIQACLGIYRANFQNILSGNVTSVKAEVPVRVLWGKEDHSLVVEQSQLLQDQCTAGYSVNYVSGGHWAFLEKVSLFQELILGKIDE